MMTETPRIELQLRLAYERQRTLVYGALVGRALLEPFHDLYADIIRAGLKTTGAIGDLLDAGAAGLSMPAKWKP